MATTTAGEPVPAAKTGVLRKAARLAGIIWIQIGLTILLFAIISTIAGQVVNAITRARDRRKPPETQAYEGAAGASWAPAYFKAMNSVRMRWYPYVYWKTAPLRSPYLNIDAHSNRVTWQPPRPPGGDGRRGAARFLLRRLDHLGRRRAR